MDGGPSKINPPNSHPSNPIHKAAMAAQNPKMETPQKKTAQQMRRQKIKLRSMK